MTVSVIISTYNWEKALNLTLMSLLNQSLLPNEIVIADDGSRAETTTLIEQYRQKSPIPIIHVWHEDNGFRLTVIRNKAIAKCSSEYIIQIDGDLILHKHFVKDHVRFARKKSFVSGSRVTINESLTSNLLANQSINVSYLTKGTHSKTNGMYIPFLSRLKENHRKNDLMYVRGCNMAFWRDDLVEVNGYNETMLGWGGEDNEIACRLLHIGVEKRIIKFSGIVFHLYHPMRSRSELNINVSIFKSTIESKITRASLGLDQYL